MFEEVAIVCEFALGLEAEVCVVGRELVSVMWWIPDVDNYVPDRGRRVWQLLTGISTG